MKKNIIVVFLVLLLVGAAVYFLLTNKSGGNQLTKNLPQVVNQKKEEVTQEIRKMISKNVSLRCSYETPEGAKVTAYLKGTDKVRSTVEGKDKINEAIFLKGKVYIWDNKTKEGMVFSAAQAKSQKNEETIIDDPAKYVEELEKTKAQCRQEIISDSVFQPPSDIKFQDLDKIQEMMNQGNFQMPEQETEE